MSLKLEDYFAASDPGSVALTDFAKNVDTDTGGRVKIKVFPNGQLVAENDAVSSIVSGASDLGISGDDQFAALMPGVDVASAPFLVKSWDGALALVQSATVRAFLAKQFGSHGLHFLGLIPNGFSNLITKSEVRSPSDLKGMKVRVPGTSLATIMQALAAVPVTLSLGDVFEGLQTGTISGAATTVSGFETFHLYQLAKYVSLVPLNMAWYDLAINESTWKRLSASEQAVVTRDALAATVAAGKGYQAAATSTASQLASQGAKVLTPTADETSQFESALKALQQKTVSASSTGSSLSKIEISAMQGS